jgi:hypothetical protein
MRRGPISPRVHGMLDYLLAAALIAVPLAVDFHDDTATVLMLVLGGAATLLAIGTNWSTGIGSCRRSCTRRRGHRRDDRPDHRTVRARLHRRHGRDRALRRDRCRRTGRNAADRLRIRSEAGRAHRFATARCLSPSPSSPWRPQRRPAILAVDDDPAVLAAVARDERGFVLARSRRAGEATPRRRGAPFQAPASPGIPWTKAPSSSGPGVRRGDLGFTGDRGQLTGERDSRRDKDPPARVRPCERPAAVA